MNKEYNDSAFKFRNTKRDYTATIVMCVVWILAVALLLITPTI
jgi:hypothetical protein